MKTIEEAAKQYGMSRVESQTAYTSFIDGVEFAQRWISIEEELPPLYIDIVCKELSGYDCYKIFSSKERDKKIVMNGITHWRPIELK